jgi:hypothetical protein
VAVIDVERVIGRQIVGDVQAGGDPARLVLGGVEFADGRARRQRGRQMEWVGREILEAAPRFDQAGDLDLQPPEFR